MTGALLSFSAMAMSIRFLAGTLSVMEILAVRAGLGLIVMLALAAARSDLRAAIFSRHLPLHIFRNTVHLGGQYLWAMSLLLLPLATVFALEFTTPAWSLLLAIPVLGERTTASRVGAVVLGLTGVLVILQPGLATFQPAAGKNIRHSPAPRGCCARRCSDGWRSSKPRACTPASSAAPPIFASHLALRMVTSNTSPWKNQCFFLSMVNTNLSSR